MEILKIIAISVDVVLIAVLAYNGWLLRKLYLAGESSKKLARGDDATGNVITPDRLKDLKRGLKFDEATWEFITKVDKVSSEFVKSKGRLPVAVFHCHDWLNAYSHFGSVPLVRAAIASNYPDGFYIA